MDARIGTCGWSYKDWVGPFYPEGTAAGDFLERYTDQFDAVEVDSTFYRTPSAGMVRNWDRKTPDDFRFCLKMVREVTHDKALADCARRRDAFLDAVAPLGPKLQAVLLQFGYFNRKAFAAPGAFFERLDAFLDDWPADVPVAVETRNRNYLGGEFFDLLRSHGAALALADHAWMPPVPELLEEHGADLLTGEFLYLRLIGDRKGIEKITTRWDKVVVDRGEAIQSIVAALRRVMPRAQLAAFINNHFAGYAPAVARAFLDALGARPRTGSAHRRPPDTLFD